MRIGMDPGASEAKAGEKQVIAGGQTDGGDGGFVLGALNVCKSFDSKSWALTDASLTVGKGEIVCIVGPNGSGKTTLLRCLNLLCVPTKGRIVFHNQVIGDWDQDHKASQSDVRNVRKNVAMVFQHFELFPHLTAESNVALGPRRVLKMTKQEAKQRAEECLATVGLSDCARKRPSALSGGQKQRVAIARALAMSPEVILFDEPTSALDPGMVEEVLKIMLSLAKSHTTMVVVTHELAFARQAASRIVTMERGRVIEDGPADLMFSNPRYARSRELLGSSSAD
ncbi:MAG: amino acid ABC transporter ATP-binding protein [Streptosporangiaceae bacterium]